MPNTRPTKHTATVSLDEVSVLCNLMVSLSRAGIPLDNGLVQLGRDLPGRLSQVSQELGHQLQQGANLAELVAREDGVFPPVYASVVEAGLRSGKTTVALEGFARLAKQIAELRRLVISALAYPLIVLVTLTVISFFLFRELGPQLRDFFLDRIPGSTAGPMVTVYVWLCHWFWLFPLAFIVLAAFWFFATRSARAAQPSQFADWVRWVPGANRMLRNSRLLAFTEVLTLLIQQRVPLHEAVRIAGSASGDRGLRTDSLALSEQLERGETVAPAASSATKHGIPPFLRWGIFHSGQLGKLEPTLARAARTYRRRTEDAAFWLRTFLPACFSLCIGGVVCFVYAMMFFWPWLTIIRQLAEPIGIAP